MNDYAIALISGVITFGWLCRYEWFPVFLGLTFMALWGLGAIGGTLAILFLDYIPRHDWLGGSVALLCGVGLSLPWFVIVGPQVRKMFGA